MYYRRNYISPIGQLTLASDGEFLTGLWIQDQKHFAKNHSDPIDLPDLPLFQEVVTWLDRYFAGEMIPADLLPLKPAGTPFQEQVWDILTTIPAGQTTTYGQIAKMLSRPGASQAVGSAIGRNPISIIIPCHRVLSSNRKLTGYAGGIPAKLWLLRHEGVTKFPETDVFTAPSLVIPQE